MKKYLVIFLILIAINGYGFSMDDTLPELCDGCQYAFNFNYGYGFGGTAEAPAEWSSYLLLPGTTDKLLIPGTTDAILIP